LVLNEIKDKIKAEEYAFAKERIEASDKKVLVFVKCYRRSKD